MGPTLEGPSGKTAPPNEKPLSSPNRSPSVGSLPTLRHSFAIEDDLVPLRSEWVVPELFMNHCIR